MSSSTWHQGDTETVAVAVYDAGIAAADLSGYTIDVSIYDDVSDDQVMAHDTADFSAALNIFTYTYSGSETAQLDGRYIVVAVVSDGTRRQSVRGVLLCQPVSSKVSIRQGAPLVLSVDINGGTADVDAAESAVAVLVASYTASLSAAVADAVDATEDVGADLATHTGAATGAHAATAISVVPSGNVSSTNAGAAINELQADIDTRATSASLTAHAGRTDNPHGVTAEQAGAAATNHAHSGTYEPVLGNPDADGYVLSSTTLGVRSWIARLLASAAETISGVWNFSTGLWAGYVRTGKIYPASDGTNSVQILKADGTTPVTTWSTTTGNMTVKYIGSTAGIYLENGCTIYGTDNNGNVGRMFTAHSGGSFYVGPVTASAALTSDLYLTAYDDMIFRVNAQDTLVTVLTMAETGTSTFAGKVILPASTTARAPLNIPAGTAPTSPVNGDMWVEGTDLKFRIGGTTYTLTKT